jgi:hypothetical protein
VPTVHIFISESLMACALASEYTNRSVSKDEFKRGTEHCFKFADPLVQTSLLCFVFAGKGGHVLSVDKGKLLENVRCVANDCWSAYSLCAVLLAGS